MGFNPASCIVDGTRKRELHHDWTEFFKNREVRLTSDQGTLGADYNWVLVGSENSEDSLRDSIPQLAGLKRIAHTTEVNGNPVSQELCNNAIAAA